MDARSRLSDAGPECECKNVTVWQINDVHYAYNSLNELKTLLRPFLWGEDVPPLDAVITTPSQWDCHKSIGLLRIMQRAIP